MRNLKELRKAKSNIQNHQTISSQKCNRPSKLFISLGNNYEQGLENFLVGKAKNEDPGVLKHITEEANTSKHSEQIENIEEVVPKGNMGSVYHKQKLSLPQTYTDISRGKVKKNKKEAIKRHKMSLRKTLNITYFILLPDDPIRAGWNAYLLLLLSYATIVTPFRTAFFDYEPLPWIIVDACVDFFFLLDMIQNFFYAYYDSDGNIVTDRKKIALKYLYSWFILDLVAILPFNLLVSSFSRASRLYRMLKMTKIVRTLRVCREKNNWMGKLEKFIPELNPSAERLIAFGLTFIVLCHVTACLWYLTAKLEGIYPDSWVARYSFQDQTIYELYIASFYFTVTTITTVGYGDISPGTSLERWFGVILMILGVMAYTFAISSLSSIITTNDIRETKKNEAIDLLHRIDMKYQLETHDYLTLNQHIIKKFKEVENYQTEKALLSILGRKEREKLKEILYKKIVKEMRCFEKLDKESAEFQAFADDMSSMFKLKKYKEDTVVYTEKEKVDYIYFILKGSINYVLPEFNDDPYGALEGKGQIFGELEIFNGIIEGKGIWGKRIFSAKTNEESEFLLISKTDLMRLYMNHNEQVGCIFENAYPKLEELLERKGELENDLTKHLEYSKEQMNKQRSKSLQTTPMNAIHLKELKIFDTIQIENHSLNSSSSSLDILNKVETRRIRKSSTIKNKEKKDKAEYLKNVIKLEIEDYIGEQKASKSTLEERGRQTEEISEMEGLDVNIPGELGRANILGSERQTFDDSIWKIEHPPISEGGVLPVANNIQFTYLDN